MAAILLVHGAIAAETDQLCTCDTRAYSPSLYLLLNNQKHFQCPVLQVALLRQKLAAEQQRARTAEASLAAQHQMQELLHTAVQAVLRTRGQPKVIHQGIFLCQ